MTSPSLRTWWGAPLRAVVHAAVAVAVTWPLAAHLDELPLGTERSRTVPMFNLWSLSWVADRLPEALSGLWDAPIFAPHEATFAWSEPQIPTGIAFAVLRLATGAVPAYGIVLLVTLTLNGLLVARLARRLGAGLLAATIAGVVAQTAPFVIHELGVLQLTMLWPTAGTLAAVVAWRIDQRPRHAVEAGAFVALTALTCGYYGVLLVIAAITVPVLMTGADRSSWRRLFTSSAITVGTALALAGPVLIAQAAHTADRRWSSRTVRANSATWSDWAPGGAWWPGWALVAAAVVGGWIGRRRPEIRWLAAIAAAALLVSLGPRLSIVGARPWDVVDRLPGFDRMRSPFRAAAFTQLALVGCAVPALERACGTRRHGQRRLLAALPVCLIAIALVALQARDPVAMAAPLPSEADDAVAFLAATADRDAVIVLPFAPTGRTADFEVTVAAMLDALDHRHPLVNGYSGLFPDDHDRTRRAMRVFPDRRSVAALEHRDVGWVLIERSELSDARRERLRQWGLAVAFEGADWEVLRIDDGQAATQVSLNENES